MANTAPLLPTNIVPSVASDLPRWLNEQMTRIRTILNSPPTLAVTYVAPTKPQIGVLYFADGTHWDPGSGRGVYCYDTTGPAYRFLG